jgi:RsiW-degrading membrane proteinase PrsW (M82 family)
MNAGDGLENDILLRNALRLGVSARARDAAALAAAIRGRLRELGFRETGHCGYCRRPVPDFSVCPYCSAPRAVAPARAAPHDAWAAARSHVNRAALGRSLRHPYFWGVVFLATAPMVLKFFGLDEKWMFVYFSLFWAYVFFKLTRAPAALWRPGAFAYAFTGIVSLPLLAAWISLPPHVTEALIASDGAGAQLLGFVAGVGVREEAAKMLAIIWLLRLKSGNRAVLADPVQALVVGSLAGLGFAAVENMDYLARFQFLDRLHYTYGLYADNVTFRGSMGRVLLTPFVHAVWSGVLAYFLALAGEARRGARAAHAVTGLAAAALLHGLYDFFASLPAADLLVIAVVAVSFALWMSCYESGRSHRLGRELTF